jgi:hypothetical protein
MPSIVSFTRRISGDNSRVTQGGEGEVIECSETYDIILSSYASTVWVLLNAPLPGQGSPHPDNNSLTATGEPTVDNFDGSPIRFVAVVPYAQRVGATGGGGAGAKDTDNVPIKQREPYVLSWSTVETQEPIDEDIFGNAICTVVGEQFDPPIVESFYDSNFHEEFNWDSFDQVTHAENVGKVNAGVWRGFRPGMCLFKNFTATRYRDEEGGFYWRRTYDILVRINNAIPINNWQRRLRAEGFLAKNSNNVTVHVQKTKALTDAANANTELGSTVPRMHDKVTGRQIDDPADAKWYTFTTKDSFDFRICNIG